MSKDIQMDVLVTSSDNEFGRRFLDARKQKGLSVEDISEAIKLEPKMVHALEGDEFNNLPEAIYVQGYIRSYAEFLGIPVEPLLNVYQQRKKADPPLNRISMVTDKRKRHNHHITKVAMLVVGIAIISVMIFFAGQFFLSKSNMVILPETVLMQQNAESEEESNIEVLSLSKKETLDLTLPVSAGTSIPKDIDIKDAKEKQQVATLSQQIKENKTVSSVEPMQQDNMSESIENKSNIRKKENNSTELVSDNRVKEEEKQSENQAVSTTMPNTQAKQKSKPIWLIFKEDSWVKVEDNRGKFPLIGVKSAGSKFKLNNYAPFKIILGNGPGVEVKVGDKIFDHSAYQNAKKVASFSLSGG